MQCELYCLRNGVPDHEEYTFCCIFSSFCINVLPFDFPYLDLEEPRDGLKWLVNQNIMLH